MIFVVFLEYQKIINNETLLYDNKELKQAGKCFSNILQEASIHNLDTQLSFIDENSQNEIKKYVSEANSN